MTPEMVEKTRAKYEHLARVVRAKAAELEGPALSKGELTGVADTLQKIANYYERLLWHGVQRSSGFNGG